MKLEKRCSKCWDYKSLKYFYRDNKVLSGYRSACKICDGIVKKIYSRTRDGVISRVYTSQKQSSKHRNHPSPLYTLVELLEFSLNDYDFNLLYENWIISDFDKLSRPSFDRDDNSKGYSFDNCQWVTWKINDDNGHKDCITGKLSTGNSHKAVVGENIETGKIVNYISARNAQRETGIDQSAISRCCLEKRVKDSKGYSYLCESAGGYTWKFKN